MGAGFLLRKVRWLTAEADRSLLIVQLNVLMPCFIFRNVLGNDALSRLENLVWAPTCGAIAIAIGMVTARMVAPLAGLADRRKANTFTVTSGIYNYGYIAIPLAMAIFDTATLGVLFLVNIGVDTMLWLSGPTLLSEVSIRENWKKIFNPPLFAIFLGLAASAAHLESRMPVAAMDAIQMIGQCAVPLALMMIGAMICDHFQPRFSSGGARVVILSSLHRLALMPLVMLGAAMILPVSEELKRVLVLHAAMPAAVFPIVLVRHYDGDVPVALQVVIGTSVISMITIPLWISVGLHWVLP